MSTEVQQLVIKPLVMGHVFGLTRSRKQPKHWLKFKFLLLLLESLVLPTLAPLASATSNLNSIWLSGDDNQLPNGALSRASSQQVTPKYPDEARLQVSSSSLHPTVASLEQHHTTAASSLKRQEFERRSNIAEEQRLANLEGQTTDLNQTTNAHVEFDEEHQTTSHQPSNRRQDSDTSSRSEPPQHIQVEERSSTRSNLTQNSHTPAPSNSSSSHHPQHNNSSLQQPFIYYMTDGDKWNQSSDKSSTYEASNSPQQPPQSPDSLSQAPGARSLPANGNQQHSDADIVSYISDKTQHLQSSNVEHPTAQPWTEQEVRFSTNVPQSHTQYEQQSNHMKDHIQPPPTTVMETIQPRPLNGISALTPLVYTTDMEMPLFAQIDPSLKQLRSRYLLEPRRELRYPSTLLQQQLNGAQRTRSGASNGFRYRVASNSRLTHHSAKPRRSFFEILGSRINSWVDPESNKPTLDEEFWGEPRPPPAWQKPKRRVRSPRPKSAPSMSLYTAEPSVMQAVYIRSPNHLYYPQSFYSPSSSAAGSSDLLFRQPTLAYLAPVSQPHVAYPPRAFADKFYSDSVNDASSKGSHLSTDASQPLSQALGRQKPAAFVPVVAVSVTRTSPHPRIPIATNEAGSRSAGSSYDQTTMNPELLEYLEMKTGAPKVSQQYKAPSEDPTSNQAASSGSINRQTDTYPYKLRSALMDHSTASGVGEQTTTVKSAVFGYYPHEAQKPLLQAIGFLPQYAGLRPLVGSGARMTGGSGLHGQRLHDSLASSDQMNLMEAAEESPSLMLQLQASNFAQNDIAYPFSSRHPFDASNSAYIASGGSPQLFSTGGSTNYRPIDVYPMNRQQFPAYQIIQPTAPSATLMNPLLAGASTGGSAANTGRPNGQLMAVAGSDMSPLFGGHNGQLMLASRPSLRPFMATNQAASTDEQHPTRQPPSFVSFPFLTVNGAAGSDDNESEQSVQEDSIQAGGGRNQVNKQGKKRSSEFFASAGQLLLSALPLLLAPTLGLMFASAPLPVARYQAPINPASASAAFGSGSLHSSSSQAGIPGNYINSFSTPGHVHNASPAQLFTPAPQSYSTSSPTTTTTTTTTPTTTTTAAIAITPTANTTLTRSSAKLLPSVVGTVHRSVLVGGNPQPPTPSPASLLMLARNHSRSTVTPAPPRLLITLTTTGPLAIYTAGPTQHNVSLEPTTYGPPNEPPQHHFHQHVGNTIMMLASPDEQSNHNTSALHYEGYDGVDFDAQFADLDRPSGGSMQGASKNSADENSLLEADSMQLLNNKTPPEPLRLYPVSTWPPLRRRTVSLVTSNGNRTYEAELPSPATNRYHGHQQLELYQPMNQGLGSYSARQRLTRLRREALQQPEVGPTEPKRRRNHIKRPSPISSRAHFHTFEAAKRKQVPGREVLSSEDSRNKAAHIFTTIMAQVADENELDGHSTRSIYGGLGRDFEGGSPWTEEQSANPNTNYAHEQDDQREQQQPIDGLAMANLGPETLRKKQGGRDKIPGARLSMIRSHKLQLAPESSEEPEMEPNASGATMQLGRARGHFPPTPLESGLMGPQFRRNTRRLSQNNASRLVTDDVSQRKRGGLPLPERIFITDDTKQALMNFNSLLIKDTLAGASQEPQFTNFKASPEQPNDSPKMHRLQDNPPPETIHLWRVVSKRPRGQDRVAHETSGAASRSQEEYGGDEPSDRREPGHRHNVSYSGLKNQVNLIDEDDTHFLDAGSAGYDERPPGSQHPHLNYEPRLHSDPSDYYPPQSHNNNRQESELSQIWRHNLTEASPKIQVDLSPPKPARRRYLNTVQEQPNSVLYDLILANRSQSINSSSAFSPSDSRPPIRAQTPPPPPPLPQYNQHSYPSGHYVPSQYAAEQAFQHHDYRPRYHPASNDGQPLNSYVSAEQHSARNQYSQAGYTANQHRQQPTTDYLSEQPHWTPQQQHQQSQHQQHQHQQSQLDRNGAGETRAVNDYLKRAQFSDSDRDKLMASYLTCDGLLNDSDHCLERLSCEFSDPQNIEQANKLDRAVSSILLGHILTNTYIPNQFKQRLKSASLFGYLRQGSCSRFACHKLTNRQQQQQQQPLSS